MDSHIDIPLVNKDMKELEELELVPFVEAIKMEQRDNGRPYPLSPK